MPWPPEGLGPREHKSAWEIVLVIYDQVPALEGEDRRLLNRLIRDYERNGLGLSPEKREKLATLKKRTSELSIKVSYLHESWGQRVETSQSLLSVCVLAISCFNLPGVVLLF